MLIDFRKYRRLKQHPGRPVQVRKVADDVYHVVWKRYDMETGDELPEELVEIYWDEVLRREQELEEELAALREFMSDCEELAVHVYGVGGQDGGNQI